MSKQPKFVNVVFGDVPMRAGSDLALAMMGMMLENMAIAGYDTTDKRVQFWAGFLSSMTGTVCADVGNRAAKEVLTFLLESAIDTLPPAKEVKH